MYLTEKQVSELLQIKVGTLRMWRWLGKGPKYIKLGRLVRYPEKQFKEEEV